MAKRHGDIELTGFIQCACLLPFYSSTFTSSILLSVSKVWARCFPPITVSQTEIIILKLCIDFEIKYYVNI